MNLILSLYCILRSMCVDGPYALYNDSKQFLRLYKLNTHVFPCRRRLCIEYIVFSVNSGLILYYTASFRSVFALLFAFFVYFICFSISFCTSIFLVLWLLSNALLALYFYQMSVLIDRFLLPFSLTPLSQRLTDLSVKANLAFVLSTPFSAIYLFKNNSILH